jgi:hypothetical protein
MSRTYAYWKRDFIRTFNKKFKTGWLPHHFDTTEVRKLFDKGMSLEDAVKEFGRAA